MWIYLKNNWVLFILKMSGSRGSPCTWPTETQQLAYKGVWTNKARNWNDTSNKVTRNVHTRLFYCSFRALSITSSQYSTNNCTILFLRYLNYNITLHIPTSQLCIQVANFVSYGIASFWSPCGSKLLRIFSIK